MAKKIFEKLHELNSPKDEIVFKMEYKGKVLHKKNIEMPEYAQEIIEDEELNFYYFFKDMANMLEEKINEIHKKKAWEELKKTTNGSDSNTDKDKK